MGLNGASEIKQHAWFASVDWAQMEARRVPPPMVPRLQGVQDTSNFANYDQEMTPPPQNLRNDKNLWQMWEWVDTAGMHIHNVVAAPGGR